MWYNGVEEGGGYVFRVISGDVVVGDGGFGD